MTLELIAVFLLLLSHLVMAGGLGGLLWLSSRLAPGLLSAESRSWCWMATLLLATLLPLGLLVFTLSPVEYQATQSLITITADTNPPQVKSTSHVPVLISNSRDLTDVANQTAYVLSPVQSLLLGLFILGALWRSRQFPGMWQAGKQLLKQSQPANLPDSISRHIVYPVKTTSGLNSPVAIGLWRPVILLPESLLQHLTPVQLLNVLLHEQAHHDRKDLWFSLIERIILMCFWWSPLLPAISRQIALSREIACDRRAANSSGCDVEFAQSLLSCARLKKTKAPNRQPLVAGWSSHTLVLDQRVDALLKGNPSVSWNLPVLLLSASMLVFGTMTVTSQVTDLLGQPGIKRLLSQYQLQSTDVANKFIQAIEQRNILALQQLVAQGADINLPMAKAGTPLMFAVHRDDLATTRTLLELRADPNQAAHREGNPLIIAAAMGNLPIAQLLLTAGADINAVVPRDETPLINAAHSGHLAMVKFLVGQGADINLGVRTSAHDGLEYRTPLNRAKTTKIRDYLLAHGAMR